MAFKEKIQWVEMFGTTILKTHRFGNDTISPSLLQALWKIEILEAQAKIPLSIREEKQDTIFENEREGETITFLNEEIQRIVTNHNPKYSSWAVLYIKDNRRDLVMNNIYKDPNNRDEYITLGKIVNGNIPSIEKKSIWIGDNLPEVIKTSLWYLLEHDSDLVSIEEVQPGHFAIFKIILPSLN